MEGFTTFCWQCGALCGLGTAVLGVSNLFVFLLTMVSTSTRSETVVSNGVVSARGRAISFTAICLGNAACNKAAGRRNVCRLGTPTNSCALIMSTVNCGAIRGPIGLANKRETERGVAVAPRSARLSRIIIISGKVDHLGHSTFGTMTLSAGRLRGSGGDLDRTLTGTPKVGIHRSKKINSSVRLALSNFDNGRMGVFVSNIPRRNIKDSFKLGGVPIGFTRHVRVCGNIIPMNFNASTVKNIVGVVAGGGQSE